MKGLPVQQRGRGNGRNRHQLQIILGMKGATVQDLASLQTMPEQAGAGALFGSLGSLAETIFTETFQRPDLDSKQLYEV
jgi:hypothetical protein